MIELRSKCCGAKVYEEADNETLYTEWYHRETYCSKCNKPTEVEKKKTTEDYELDGENENS